MPSTAIFKIGGIAMDKYLDFIKTLQTRDIIFLYIFDIGIVKNFE